MFNEGGVDVHGVLAHGRHVRGAALLVHAAARPKRCARSCVGAPRTVDGQGLVPSLGARLAQCREGAQHTAHGGDDLYIDDVEKSSRGLEDLVRTGNLVLVRT